jgi:PKD repeat protein
MGYNGVTSKEENPSFTYTESGVYTAKLEVVGDGGTNWAYKLITVNPKPVADFTFSDAVVLDSSQSKGYDKISFYNHTKYGDYYRWYFDAANSLLQGYSAADSYEKEPVWAYADVGVYSVALVAESEQHCFDTLLKQNAIKVIGEGETSFPTIFFVNPNGAAADEYSANQHTPNFYLFYPKTEGVDEYSLEIYDRWGSLIFKTTDVNRGWNGYIDNVVAKQGVYIWRCKGRYSNGKKFNDTGDITLIVSPVNIDPN